MDKTYDCSGWATKANLLCSDGRIIMKDAFKEADGTRVPLVWNHQHNRPEEILGHALLENRDEGVYAYCSFNDTESGQAAKMCVQHGDINALSIYANKLKHNGRNVVHGIIREVSLVLAGANPGASIDSVIMHSDDTCEEGYIYTGEFIENFEPLFHADSEKKGESEVAEPAKKEKTVADILNELTEEQRNVVYALIGQAIEESKDNDMDDDMEDKMDDKKEDKMDDKEMKHAAAASDDKTIGDVLNELTEEQKTVVYALIGEALENGSDYVEGGNDNMKHNVFEQDSNQEDTLIHFDMDEIVDTAKHSNGSLRDALSSYASLKHGIEDIDLLFPDAKSITNVPEFIKRDDTWVADVMNGVHHTPFSRIKSVVADITETDARAKGYIKGNIKAEEFFSLLKRTTTPTTIYKKQRLDRDDIVDITDFDVVAWLKMEMRMMLEEEIARAILVGDGRNPSSDDKINEQCIRPIWTDDDIYTVKKSVPVTSSTKEDEKAKAFIKACIRSRKDYKGSGNPVMYMDEDVLTECLLIEDTNGRIIYDSVDKLATALRVKKIVTVPVMENLTRIVGSDTHKLAGIYVNLADYNVGADKGGAVNMFDDFDIDYNSQKYLIETRCSGALTKPYSAVAIEFVQTGA